MYGEFGISKEIYKDTYYAELKDKIERLETRENRKIIFIGGSSLIFGLRSEEIEKATGYDVVDFGLYASLGTPIMMRLAEPYIKEGDVVVLAPEINEQTYSSYVGYEAALKCFENMNYPLTKFSLEDNMKFFFHYFKFTVNKCLSKVELEPPYDKASFNDFCDIDNEIVYNNILPEYYDITQPIAPNSKIIEKDFVKEVNSFYHRLNNKNIKMYFSFSPTNQLALEEDNLLSFNETLEKKLDCPILGSVKDFTYHQYYFYDTNFHLNKTGSYLHSKKLSDLLKEELEIENTYEIPVPEAPHPKYRKSDVINIIDGAKYQEVFDYQDNFTYSFVGLVDELKDIEEYKVLDEVNGVKVTSIDYQAFDNMPNLTKLTISKGVNNLLNPLFKNCPQCIALYLEHDVPPMVCFEGLVDDASPNIKIYVKKASYTKYTSGYTWMAYLSYFETY